jgi:hypothetical protein
MAQRIATTGLTRNILLCDAAVGPAAWTGQRPVRRVVQPHEIVRTLVSLGDTLAGA